MKKTILVLMGLCWMFFAKVCLAGGSGGGGFRIAGSSTVYPFVSFAAENFVRDNKGYNLPIIESVGTGNGFKAFCGGGDSAPHIVSASRFIKPSEMQECKKNQITDVIAFTIGYDAITIAQGLHEQWAGFSLTKEQLFLAVAKFVDIGGKLALNPYKYWSDIDKNLPRRKIIIYGPPTTSGTRDSFVELVMFNFCMQSKAFSEAFADEKLRKTHCGRVRSDGAFIDVGENDNVTVRKLGLSRDAIGILGYDYLAQNQQTINAIKIEGQGIKSDVNTDDFNFSYPLLRPIFLVSSAQIVQNNAIVRNFLQYILSEKISGENGALAEINLIPLRPQQITEQQKKLGV